MFPAYILHIRNMGFAISLYTYILPARAHGFLRGAATRNEVSIAYALRFMPVCFPRNLVDRIVIELCAHFVAMLACERVGPCSFLWHDANACEWMCQR